jgi:CHAT domain-containing protein
MEYRNWLARAARLRVHDVPEAGPQCLTEEQITRMAVGEAMDNSAELLDHIASCDRCGSLLHDALPAETGAEETMADLRTSSPEWRAWTAGRFAAAGRKPRRWYPLVAAAACLVVASGLALWWWQRRADDPAVLLASAYTTARPFEYRLPDNGYGRIQQQRSGSVSSFDRPPALAKAVTEIQQQLADSPDRAALLALKGRAELIERQYDSAIKDLTLASEMDPAPPTLEDLGCAWALEADVEGRNAGYGHAIDLFLRALRARPDDARALFNLAVTYEKISMIDESIETWTRLLRVEPNGPWAVESRQHLKDARNKERKHKGAENLLAPDPARFLRALRESGPDVEPELYQDIFWTKWLPRVRDDKAAGEAADALAELFARRFGDLSLRHAIAAARREKAAAALTELGAVIEDNFAGRNDTALAHAQDAVKSLIRSGQTVAAMRARIELAYSWRRSTIHEPCLAIAGALLRELDGKPYPWLDGQAHLEHAICAGRSGHLGASEQEMEDTQAMLQKHGLRFLALRAQTLVTSIDSLTGNDALVWEREPKVLAVYWSSAVPPSRAQQALFDLGQAAGDMGWAEMAVVAQAAAVRATERWGNAELMALNRVYLAGWLAEAGRRSDALREIDAAAGLFRELPPGRTTENLALDATLRRAEMEADGPHSNKALGDLAVFGPQPSFSSLLDRLRVFQARGIALASQGDWRSARNCFREAIRLQREHVQSLPAGLNRLAAEEIAAASFKHLEQIQLLNENDPAAALATWRAWREERARPVRSDEAALTWTALPSGVAVWTESVTGLHAAVVPSPAAELEASARRFARLCSSPSSDLRELRAVARQLYLELFPAQARAARLSVHSDGWLSSIPFEALVDERGAWLADRCVIGSDPDGARLVSARDRAVIVAAPSAGKERPDLPFLQSVVPETDALGAAIPGAVVLRGDQAAPDAIARAMRSATLFHFAGHGWSNGGNAGLILGSNAAGETHYLTADDIAGQDWKQCRLAVLSACFTAAGEERGPVNPRSLVRALLAAGAREVIASRWSVDGEATRAWMSAFYEALFAGASPADALSQASAKIRRTPGWEHPYYWAAFELFGA